MIKKIQIIITVILRFFGVLFFAAGLLYGLLFALALFFSGHVSDFSIAGVAIPMVMGNVVWFLAKPCAEIVTLGLDE